MATVIFDRRGWFSIVFLYERRTINAEYYGNIWLKYRPYDLSVRDVIILQTNARPHIAAMTDKSYSNSAG